jgi:teichuronic acid exporter
MVDDSLKSKTLRGLSWTFIESVGVGGVQFAIGIGMARLLLPEEFGQVGILAVFIAVAQVFLDSGFGPALIQKRNASQVDACSVFCFNIVIGLAAAGLLCLAAPWIAAFYKQPILTPMTRWLSLTFVINSLGLIHNTLLRKEMNFKAQARVNLIACLLSGIVGISAAYSGFGVWSLVAQQIVGSALGTTGLWLSSAWRPSPVFSFVSLRSMFGFGSRILADGLLFNVFDNIYSAVIGKLFYVADVGFFSRAKRLQELSASTFSIMVGRVTFPAFATLQDDPVRLKRGLSRALATLATVNFPLMIGLALTAEPLVIVLFTDKWAPAIPYLQLLCGVGLLAPLSLVHFTAQMAVGRSGIILARTVVDKVLIILNIAITWRWGIQAMILGQIAVTLISYGINTYCAAALMAYSFKEQMRDLVAPFAAAVLMGMAVYAVRLFSLSSHASLLAVQALVGIVVYAWFCRLIRVPAFMDLWHAGWKRAAC